MDIPYIVGQEYNRKKDLHEPFGGSRQSGMSSSAQQSVMFLFTGPGGAQHGYADQFAENGLFWYTGEGPIGDMTFTKGNKALQEHALTGRHTLLFEQTRKGFCRFLGEVLYTGFHWETKVDRNGDMRQAIVFELAFEPLETEIKKEISPAQNDEVATEYLPQKMSTSELRDLALKGSSKSVQPRTVKTRVRYRSEAVKRYALARANGICEACSNEAPFRARGGAPYLEVHHLTRIADGGPDTPDRVAAICPNCHRRAHHSTDAKGFNTKIAENITKLELTFE